MLATLTSRQRGYEERILARTPIGLGSMDGWAALANLAENTRAASAPATFRRSRPVPRRKKRAHDFL